MAGLLVSTITIGSFEYEFTILPTSKGHPLRIELLKLCGEPLVAAIADVLHTGSLGDIDIDGALKGLAGIIARLDPAFVWRMQETFIGSTRFRALGQPTFVDLGPAVDVHFAGKYHELDQLTFAHLKVNYLPFLGDSAVWQALVSAGRQALSDVQSRRTSRRTGTSGASSVASGSA
jgi:hypothetical protein